MPRWLDAPALVLTRPAAQVAAWRDALEALDVPVRSWPLIDIGPAPDPRTPAAVWQALPSARLAFFVSPNAVAAVMAARPPGASWPTACWAACVGPGSATALLTAGVPAERLITPDPRCAQFDSEALWPLLASRDWAGCPVLVIRGGGGREWLADRLREAGAQVHTLAVYQRQAPSPGPHARAQLAAWMAERPSPVWLLSSSEAVGHWQALVGALPPLPTLATHPRIAAAAQAAGLVVTEVAPTPAAVAAAWHQGRQAPRPAP